MLTSPHPPAPRPPARNLGSAITSAQAGHGVSPPAARHRLGAHLRGLRQERSLRLGDAAARLGIAAGTLSRIETGKAPARHSYLTGLLDLYTIDSPAERARLADLARQGQGKPWWSIAGWVLPDGGGTYLDLEAAATTVSIHAAHAIPGITQTLAYAHEAARLTRPDLTEFECSLLARLQARRRQELRFGCHLHLIIDDSVLVKHVGTADGITGQLRHLLALGEEPGVTLQLTSWHTTPAVLSPSFAVLTFPDAPPVTCCQGPAGQVILSRRPADTKTAQATFRAITETAASPDKSAGYIKLLTGQDY